MCVTQSSRGSPFLSVLSCVLNTLRERSGGSFTIDLPINNVHFAKGTLARGVRTPDTAPVTYCAVRCPVPYMEKRNQYCKEYTGYLRKLFGSGVCPESPHPVFDWVCGPLHTG